MEANSEKVERAIAEVAIQEKEEGEYSRFPFIAMSQGILITTLIIGIRRKQEKLSFIVYTRKYKMLIVVS